MRGRNDTLTVCYDSLTKPLQEERVWHGQHDRIAGADLLPIHSRILAGSPGRENAGRGHEANAREPEDRPPTC